MTITIDPKLEASIREKADAEGVSVAAYFERLARADQAAEEELGSLVIQELQLRLAQATGKKNIAASMNA